MVALETTIHDCGVSLLRNAFLGDLGIDPFGKAPHFGTDLAKLNRSRRVVLDDILEGLIEVAVIQEDVWVVVPAVEVTLDGLDGLNDTVQFLIPGEDDEGAIDPGLGCVWLEAALDEDLVVLFADFSGRKNEVSKGMVGLSCFRVGKLTLWLEAHQLA